MNREQQFDFAGFFNAKLKERGLSLRKLSELSGISVQDLQNLSEGDFESLPPGPYLRGYTLRLAKILEFDPEIWWHHFEDLGAVRTSGTHDQLPQNRFAISKTTKYGWIVAVAVLAVLYGGLRFSKILGRPVITVTDPASTPATIDHSPFVIRGTMKGGDQVFINDEQVPVDNGNWEKQLILEQGINTIAIRATKLLGKHADLQWQIVYEPPLPPATSSSSTSNGTSGARGGGNAPASGTASSSPLP